MIEGTTKIAMAILVLAGLMLTAGVLGSEYDEAHSHIEVALR